MAETEQKSLLERDLMHLLYERDWEVIEAKRDRVNLDLSVSFSGIPGVVSLHSAFLPARGLMKNLYQPTYLRVVLGRPDGEPSRWAVWDRYVFTKRSKYSPDYWAFVFHEAMGDDWVALAGCSVTPDQTWYERGEVIRTLLKRAEALAPGRDEDARREQIFAVQRNNFGDQKLGKNLTIFVVLVSVVVVLAGLLVTGMLMDPPADTPPDGVLVFRGLIAAACGLPILICSLVSITYLRRVLRVPRQPLEGADAIARTLRGTRAFSEVTVTARKDRDGLPLVVQNEGRLAEAKATLSVNRLTATSSSHAVKLEADLCRMNWPEGTSPQTRLVPDRWLTVELSGAGSDLAKLPTGPREERRHDVVRWTFTGKEIDSGAVESHFLTVASALVSDARLYR
jgi:hypothetical protein